MSGLGDWWWLQIAIAFIYLIECVVWVPANTLIIERRRGRYHFRLPWQGFSLRGRVPALLNPLTPWRTVYVLVVPPVTICADGVVTQPLTQLDLPTAIPGEFLPWEQIGGIWHEGRSLYLGRTTRVDAGTDALASELSERLRHLWECPPAVRERQIADSQQSAIDPAAIRERVRASADPWLATWATLLFFSLLVVLPGAIFRAGHAGSPELTAIALLWVAVLVRFWQTSDRGSPGDQRSFWQMVLLPPAAIAAITQRTRWRLCNLEPAAVVLALGDPTARSEIAASVLRDLAWPARIGEGRAEEELTAARAQLLSALRTRYPDLDRYLAPPPHDDPRCVAYCPRCHLQYVHPIKNCCPGVPLVPWPSANAPQA